MIPHIDIGRLASDVLDEVKSKQPEGPPRPTRTKISFLDGGAVPVTPPQAGTAAAAVDRLKDIGHKTTKTYMPKAPDAPKRERPVSGEDRKAANERFEKIVSGPPARKSFFGRKKK